MARPPKYTGTSFIAKTIEYFDRCKLDKTAPNKAGLCLFLDISRETYNQYRKSFPDAVKACDNEIEQWWVNRLAGNSPTGAIFYLKNAFKEEYKDRQETDITSGGEKLTITGMHIIKE